MESLLERPEATTVHPGDTDTGRSHSGSSIYHEDTGAGKHHRGILPLALALAPRPAPLLQQQIVPVLGWLRPRNHLGGDTATPISRQAALRPPAPQSPLHMALSTKGPALNSNHQPAGNSPRIPWSLVLRSREPALASRPVSPTREQIADSRNHSPPAWEPSLPISMPDPALRPAGSQFCPLAGQYELQDTQDFVSNCVRKLPLSPGAIKHQLWPLGPTARPQDLPLPTSTNPRIWLHPPICSQQQIQSSKTWVCLPVSHRKP